MSLYAVDCEGNYNGDAPMPLLLNGKHHHTRCGSENLEVMKKESPKRQRRRVVFDNQDKKEINTQIFEIPEFELSDSDEEKKSETNSFSLCKKSSSTPSLYSKSNEIENVYNIPQKNLEKPIETNTEKENSEEIQEKERIMEVKQISNGSKTEEITEINDSTTNNEDKGTKLYSFSIKRSRKSHINGKSELFRLVSDDKTLFTGKYKHGRDAILICQGEEAHISGESDYQIIMANDLEDFSLRSKSKTGTELLSMRYYSDYNRGTRTSIIAFIKRLPGIPKCIHSIDYTMEREYNDFKIKSIKNAVYKTKNMENPVAYIRKTGADEILIQTIFELEPIYYLAIGITDFICKLSGN